MDVREAQRQVRTIYMGGLIGQSVSALLWGASAAVASTSSLKSGAIALVVGGFFIFPLTQLALRIAGRPASLPPDNPLRELAIEVAIVAPLMIPLAAAAALHRAEYFYPAMAIAVGAHYLPFAFLYGMRHFLALGAAMIVVGLLAGVYMPSRAIAVAWAVAAMLLGFGLAGYAQYARESGSRARSAT